jgi:glutamyl-tRNA synthetase
MRSLAEELQLKAGQLFGIVRAATTGQKVAPPLFGLLEFLGRERTLVRIEAARQVLASSL